MLKSTRFIVLVIFLSHSYIFCFDDPLPVIHDYETDSVIDLRPVNSIEKHNHTINFRILENDSSKLLDINESPYKFKSKLDDVAKNKMLEMIKLKESFKRTFQSLPKSFRIEDFDYIYSVGQVARAFIIFGLSILFFIILYLILRFGCKKCVGPVKASHVTRFYRNLTWFILISSFSGLIIIYIFITVYSVSINQSIHNSLYYNSVKNRIYEEKLNTVSSLINTVQSQFIYKFNEDNLEKLNNGILSYINRTENLNYYIGNYEESRNIYTILLFVLFVVIFALSLLSFKKRWAVSILVLSIILLLSIPFIFFYNGLLASYFFVYSDFCHSIYNAIYSNQMPIYGKGLGFLVSCFDSQTQASLYTFRYEFDNFEKFVKEIKPNTNTTNFTNGSDTNSTNGSDTNSTNPLDTNSTNPSNSQIYMKLLNEIKNVKEDALPYLLNCESLYRQVEYVEETVCASGMHWIKYLISSYTWLGIILLLVVVGINRLKPLVEKKKSEIDSMLVNQDVGY